MANIESIRPSISTLPREEVLGIVMQIRRSRRERKPTQNKAKAKRIAKSKNILNMIDSMTPDQAAALIKKLEG